MVLDNEISIGSHCSNVLFTCGMLQVCSVLDSLEREYRRDEDWCATAPANDKATTLAQLISKHQEKKEAFLKGCTLARRNAETFLKCSARSLQFYSSQPEAGARNSEAQVKGKSSKLEYGLARGLPDHKIGSCHVWLH